MPHLKLKKFISRCIFRPSTLKGDKKLIKVGSKVYTNHTVVTICTIQLYDLDPGNAKKSKFKARSGLGHLSHPTQDTAANLKTYPFNIYLQILPRVVKGHF